jgi:hypothetical protein
MKPTYVKEAPKTHLVLTVNGKIPLRIRHTNTKRNIIDDGWLRIMEKRGDLSFFYGVATCKQIVEKLFTSGKKSWKNDFSHGLSWTFAWKYFSTNTCFIFPYFSICFHSWKKTIKRLFHNKKSWKKSSTVFPLGKIQKAETSTHVKRC